MIPAAFDYVAPDSLDAALAALAEEAVPPDVRRIRQAA
jgi:hypothetical protein